MATKKKAICPKCGHPVIYSGFKTTVYPIFFARRASLLDAHGVHINPDGTEPYTAGDDGTLDAELNHDAAEYLQSHVEIADSVKLIGAIAHPPQLFVRERDHAALLTFPLATKRHYYVPEDDMETDVDFPYVKLYGEEARLQYDILSQGNLLLIDGYLKGTNIHRRHQCDSCSERFSTDDNVMDIVPYSVEYIRENVCYASSSPDGPEIKDDNKGGRFVGTEQEASIAECTAELVEAEKRAKAGGVDALANLITAVSMTSLEAKPENWEGRKGVNDKEESANA